MTTVGADAFADAPFIELGTSSAYTPNAGYGTEAGEPVAWGGKTAWWRYTATTNQFVYVDVLHSTGNVRSWSYRAFVPDPDFADLQLLSAPVANAQGGFNAAAGGTYWIRVDSDGSDLSYVLSIGADLYDYHTETRTLTGTWSSADPAAVVEGHFDGTGLIVGGDPALEAWSRDVLARNVSGGGASYAEMRVGAYADEVIAEYPANVGYGWYDVNDPDSHPVISYNVMASPGDAVSGPVDYNLSSVRIKADIWSNGGTDLAVDGSGQVGQVRLAGSFDPLTEVRYLDEVGGVVGPVPIGSGPGGEIAFRPPASWGAGSVEFYFNDGSLRFYFLPNVVGVPGSYPVGVWHVGPVHIDFIYQSSTAIPYVPPGPPVVEAVSVLRRYPRHDALGFGGTGRNYPRPSGRRNYGGQP